MAHFITAYSTDIYINKNEPYFCNYYDYWSKILMSHIFFYKMPLYCLATLLIRYELLVEIFNL